MLNTVVNSIKFRTFLIFFFGINEIEQETKIYTVNLYSNKKFSKYFPPVITKVKIAPSIKRLQKKLVYFLQAILLTGNFC